MCKAQKQKQKQKYDDDWYLIAQAKCKLLSYPCKSKVEGEIKGSKTTW